MPARTPYFSQKSSQLTNKKTTKPFKPTKNIYMIFFFIIYLEPRKLHSILDRIYAENVTNFKYI